MDIDHAVLPLPWWLTSLPSEVLGRIGELADAWDVGRLFCCGDQKLNKLLTSSSGVRSIYHDPSDSFYISLPGMISQLKALESITVWADDEFGTKARLSASTVTLLSSLGGNQIKQLVLYNITNIEWLIDKPKEAIGKSNGRQFIFPNLTHLILASNWAGQKSIVNHILNDIPCNLTHFILTGTTNMNTEFLDKLPTSLISLRLEMGSVSLEKSWPSRLPQLTSLDLAANVGIIDFDEKTISSLPSSLTRLKIDGQLICRNLRVINTGSIGNSNRKRGIDANNSDDGSDAYGENNSIDMDSDDDDDDSEDGLNDTGNSIAFFFENLPPGLRSLGYYGPKCHRYLSKLSCWSSLRSLSLMGIDKLPELPENLEVLKLLDSSLNSPSLPSNLKRLVYLGGSDVQNLASLAPKLETLEITYLGPESFSTLPRHITSLHLVSFSLVSAYKTLGNTVLHALPLLQILPKGSLSCAVDGCGWTWLHVRRLGKFIYNDLRYPTVEILSTIPSLSSSSIPDSPLSSGLSPLPFSGLGGSGWTSIGHAIMLDSVSLFCDILRIVPSTWREVTHSKAFLTAIRFESMKILAWFEKMHLLERWRYSETFSFRSTLALSEAFICNRPKIIEWLLSMGFSIPIGNLRDSNMVPLAMDSDCLPLLEHLLCRLPPPTTMGTMDYLPTIRFLALTAGAKQCWNHLMSLNDAKTPDGDAKFLSELVDMEDVFQETILLDSVKSLECVEDMMRIQDKTVERVRQKDDELLSVLRATHPGFIYSTTAEMLCNVIRSFTLLNIPLTDGRWLHMEWFLAKGIISMNEPSLGISFTGAVMHTIQEHQMEIKAEMEDTGTEDEDSEDDGGDERDEIDANDEDDGNMEENDGIENGSEEEVEGWADITAMLCWLIEQGADLWKIEGMKMLGSRAKCQSIHDVVATWPHRERWERALVDGTIPLPSCPY